METTPPRLRRAYFECRHGQLHVHNAIPVGGGFDELTTLICLHGATGTGRRFLEVSRRLGSSRSIYSPDLPGSGESDAAATPLTIAGFAEAIADFLDSMRFRQVDLLGTGAGVGVAVELAIARPKVVRRLVLLGQPAEDAAAGNGGKSLLSAASQWSTDRRQLARQPALALASGADIESDAQSIAGKLAEFLDGP